MPHGPFTRREGGRGESAKIYPRYVNELQESLEDTYKVAEVDAALATKAAQTALDATNTTVSNHTGQITTAEGSLTVLTAKVYDPADAAYGAVRSLTAPSAGVMTANTAAINAAAADAYADGGMLVIKGTYFVNGTVTIRCHVDGRSGILRTASTALSPVLRAGSVTSGDFVADLVMHLPQVFGDGKAALGNGTWGTDTGLQLGNLISCDVFVSQVQGFGTGVHITAVGTGFSYNELTFGHVRNNKVNLHIEPGTGGYCNQTNAYGGRFSHLTAEGTNVAGVRHIKVSANGAHAVNAWKFHTPSIEGNTPEYHLDLTEMMYSIFDNARYEASPPKALRTNCNGVLLDEGYNAGALVITDVTTINWKQNTRDWEKFIAGAGTAGLLRLANTSSNDYPAIATSDTTATGATDFTTAYAWIVTARAQRMKLAAHAQDRIVLDWSTNTPKIRLGFGTSSVTDVEFGRVAANVLGMSAGDGFRFATTTTAGRPTAALMGAGTCVYDTDLAKPIWSDGTVWRDAAGTAV